MTEGPVTEPVATVSNGSGDAANTAARSMRELMGLGQRLHDGVLRATLREQL